MAAKASEPIETRLFINNEVRFPRPERLQTRQPDHFQFRESSSKTTFDVVYPYTKEVVAKGKKKEF